MFDKLLSLALPIAQAIWTMIEDVKKRKDESLPTDTQIEERVKSLEEKMKDQEAAWNKLLKDK